MTLAQKQSQAGIVAIIAFTFFMELKYPRMMRARVPSLVYFPAALLAFQQLLGQFCAARVARYDYAIERLCSAKSARSSTLAQLTAFADEAAQWQALTYPHTLLVDLRCGVVRNFTFLIFSGSRHCSLRYELVELIVAASAAGAFTSGPTAN